MRYECTETLKAQQTSLAPQQLLNDAAQELLDQLEHAQTLANIIEDRLYESPQGGNATVSTLPPQPCNLQSRLNQATRNIRDIIYTLESIQARV